MQNLINTGPKIIMMKNLNSRGEAPIKLAVVLIVILVAAGVVVALKPWEWLNKGQGTVRFYHRAYFYLIGTNDNEPLENIEIAFPDPNIDNKALEPRRTYIPNGAFWTLYAYVDNELVVEIDRGNVMQLVGPRASTVNYASFGYGDSNLGPKLIFHGIDKLYPGEVLEVTQLLEIPADMVNRLTLEDEGPEPNSTFADISPSPVKRIDAQFFAGLYRINDDNTLQKVEEFERTIENGSTGGWWELAPV